MDKNSYILGISCGLIVGFSSWFQLHIAGLTVQALDILWLYLAIIGLLSALMRRRSNTATIWAHPVSSFTFGPFWLALIVGPIVGVLFNQAPGSALSSSARFIIVSTFPVLLHILRPHYGSLFRGLVTGISIAVLGNVIYGTLQVLEFNGYFPLGTLPHHDLAHIISGNRFRDWGRASGFFLSGNHLGYFGFASLVLFWAQYLRKPSTSVLALSLGAISLTLLGNSRSSLILSVGAVLVMPIVWAAARRRLSLTRILRVSGLILLFATAVLIAFSTEEVRNALKVDRYLRLVQVFATGDIAADNSLRTRLEEFWPLAVTAMEEYPLGYGAEPSVYLTGTIDSAWLTYFVQGSVLLVMLFANLLIGAIFVGWKAMRTGGNSYKPTAGLALISLSAGLMLGSALLSPLHVPSMSLLFVLIYQIGGALDSRISADWRSTESHLN